MTMQILKGENMSEFNFKSSVCTSIQQSEKLLALGLKKETADMRCLWEDTFDSCIILPTNWEMYRMTHENIPAWSLHRLLSMLPDNAPRIFWILDGANISIEWDNDGTDFFPHKGDIYEGVVNCIEWLIKEGYFPKEYLV